MKSVLVIGLGNFGMLIVKQIHELGHQVMAIDKNESRVNEALPYVTNALIGDSTNANFLASLGINNYDVCIETIGNDFQSSLEITSLLKDLGAKFVLSRASRDIHAKFLLRNGADQVVYPEKEMAIRSAVRYSSDNIFDYIELTPEHSIYEIPVPEGWIGRSIIEMNIRKKYNISILAVKYNDTLHPLPGADYTFKANDELIILGANRDINRFVY